MKAEDVPDAWMHAALAAYRGVEGDAAHRIRAALAAAAPLIADAERERCAMVAEEQVERRVVTLGVGGSSVTYSNAVMHRFQDGQKIAAAIRAQGDA